jgi:hypothetical protein
MSEKTVNSEDIKSISSIVSAFAASHPKSSYEDCAQLFAILLSECAAVINGKVRWIKYPMEKELL